MKRLIICFAGLQFSLNEEQMSHLQWLSITFAAPTEAIEEVMVRRSLIEANFQPENLIRNKCASEAACSSFFAKFNNVTSAGLARLNLPGKTLAGATIIRV